MEDSSETSQVQNGFASNKPLYLLHMDFYEPMRVESINGKRYVLVVVDDYSRCYLLNNCDDIGKLKAKGDIGVFVAFRIYNKRTRKIPESVNVNFDEISEMASKQYSLEPEESSSSSPNDDVQQSSEEVMVPSSNTQSVSNKIVPNVDEASTSHNVFNERLEDAYFDASTTFHDPSNVHTLYQPCWSFGIWYKVYQIKLIRFHVNEKLLSQGDCFIPFDINQSFSLLVNLLEVKQYVSTSVKEIDNVQLGIVNQAELKLLPKAFFSFCTTA
ncbi:copia protein [Tanacetum coccineum]|uniref:Copia protein n=1 Tax=Tanacetum coccineum TaxID=301880 RepID=A0ABQ5F7V4_9ASTR